jgi:hypothetical protein
LKKAGVTSGEAFKQLTDLPSLLVKPGVDDQVKIKALTDIYGTSQGLLGEFKPDYYDPNTHSYVRGRNSVFADMTKPEITKEIYRLSSSNRAVWNNYKTWAQDEFGEQIFSKEVHDLNQPLPKGVQVQWNTDTKHFTLLTPDHSPIRTARQFGQDPNRYPEVVQTRQSLETLNRGLDSLKVIAQQEGGDVEKYLLQNLVKYGADLTAKNSPITGLDHVIRALQPPMEEKPGVGKKSDKVETNQRLGMDLELAPQTIKEWAKNPIQNRAPQQMTISEFQSLPEGTRKTIQEDGSVIIHIPGRIPFVATPKLDNKGKVVIR